MIVPDTSPEQFRISKENRNYLLNKESHWEDNAIGLITLYRTYLRKKENGALETWNEAVIRVIEGMFSIQKTHILRSGLEWNEEKAQKTALEAAERLFEFKWTPPGRGLWMMGTDFMWSRGGAALNNCGFCTTENLDKEGSEPFRFLMDMSMLGVGIGFDTKGAGKLTVQEPQGETETYVVEDTREGWVEAIGKVIDSYLFGTNPIQLDTSKVRPYGSPIRGFGGVASGPKPLIQGFNGIRDILRNRAGGKITSVDITDIQNIIGKIVVAGNVRRTAEIAFSDPNDAEFRKMKSWKDNPESMGVAPPKELKKVCKEEYDEMKADPFGDRAKEIAEKYQDEEWAYKFGGWRWTSNNSLFAQVGMDYTEIAESIAENGEPGLAWLENMQNYSRMIDKPDYKDTRVSGGNPCFTGDTNLLTDRGYSPIEDVVGQSINVWNGEEWSRVTPFSTGENEIVQVNLTDGTSIRCTPYHEFLTVKNFNNSKQYRVEAQDLQPGTKLQKWDMPMVENGEKYDIDPYSQGFYSGDGNKGYKKSWVYGPKEPCFKRLIGKRSNYYSDRDAWEWHHGAMLDKSFVPVDGDSDYCLNWFAGILDADGTVTRDENGNGFQIVSIDHDFLYRTKLMLSRLGVRAKVVHSMDARQVTMTNQRGETGTYDCKETKRLLVGNQDAYHLINLGIKFERLEVHSNPPQRDARQYIKVKSVEWLGVEEETFCVTEPKLNQMTVEGIVTGNCLEQSLEPYELCTLVETYPVNHKSAKDYYETLKVAYLYAKTVTLMATHNTRTNTVMCRNRRIGCSQSGVIDAIAEFGRHYYQKNILDKAYHKIQEFDNKYSEWLGIPKSIKTTSIKPSGSVSLLANVSPGVHFPKVRHGYRTMRLAKDSPIVNALKESGYHVEASNSDPYQTVVAYFPIIGREEVPTEADSTIWEQFTNAVMMQKYWADNQVSVTISFKAEEKNHIAKCLSTFDSELKGVSLLPLIEHGFSQAPYIPADKQEVLDYRKKLSPLDLSGLNLGEGENADANKFCDGENCAI